jgi:hypothetical protein
MEDDREKNQSLHRMHIFFGMLHTIPGTSSRLRAERRNVWQQQDI